METSGIKTYGVTGPRIKRRQSTEKKWHDTYKALYPELFDTIEKCNGWYQLNFTTYRKEHNINRVPYEILHQLRIHPNIISRMSDMVKGAVRGIMEYHWVTPEEKERKKFRSLFLANIGDKQIERLERAFPEELSAKDIADIMAVYDYCVKTSMEDNWVHFSPNVVAMEYGVLLEDVFRVMMLLEDRKLAIVQEATAYYKSSLNICHLVCTEKDYDILQEELITREAYKNIIMPGELSKRRRWSKKERIQIAPEREAAILKAADASAEFGNETEVLKKLPVSAESLSEDNFNKGLDSQRDYDIIDDAGAQFRVHLSAIKGLMKAQFDKTANYRLNLALIEKHLVRVESELRIAQSTIDSLNGQIAELQEQINSHPQLSEKDRDKLARYDDLWNRCIVCTEENGRLKAQADKAISASEALKKQVTDEMKQMRRKTRTIINNYDSKNGMSKNDLMDAIEEMVVGCYQRVLGKAMQKEDE